jgi:hypothetical protein
VPATEVARRAGHGVAVLLKIYAHSIDGQAAAANQRIADALGIQDAEQDLGDEGDGDTEQASGDGRSGLEFGWERSGLPLPRTVWMPLLPSPSVDFSAPVRGPSPPRPWILRPRPWPARPRNPVPTDA